MSGQRLCAGLNAARDSVSNAPTAREQHPPHPTAQTPPCGAMVLQAAWPERHVLQRCFAFLGPNALAFKQLCHTPVSLRIPTTARRARQQRSMSLLQVPAPKSHVLRNHRQAEPTLLVLHCTPRRSFGSLRRSSTGPVVE